MLICTERVFFFIERNMLHYNRNAKDIPCVYMYCPVACDPTLPLLNRQLQVNIYDHEVLPGLDISPDSLSRTMPTLIFVRRAQKGQINDHAQGLHSLDCHFKTTMVLATSGQNKTSTVQNVFILISHGQCPAFWVHVHLCAEGLYVCTQWKSRPDSSNAFLTDTGLF